MSWDASELNALGTRVTRAGAALGPQIKNVVSKSALDVKADAAGAAPVDTGALRSSITVTSEGGGAGSTSASISPGVNYGIYVELGTSRMAAQPYLFPALERRSEPFLQAVGLAAQMAVGRG